VEPTFARELKIECSTISPSMRRRVASGSASQAARRSANSVWPPMGATLRA
jgi:hypothetical protein